MTDARIKEAYKLRKRAELCRSAASIKTTGGHETDLLLILIAEQLEGEVREWKEQQRRAG